MNIIRKTIHIVGKENKKGLIYLLFLNLINFFLEFVSIISIPLFTAALLSEQLKLDKLQAYLDIWGLDNDKILIYATLLVIISFLAKNFLLAYNAYFQANYLKKIRSNLSKKFFNYYFETKNINNSGLKPPVMARNVTHVVQGFYAYCENLNKLIRELIAALTIAIIISFLNLKISLTLILLFIVVSYLYFTYLRPKIKTKAFKSGLAHYLQKHSYKNAKTADLWESYALATNNTIDVAKVLLLAKAPKPKPKPKPNGGKK